MASFRERVETVFAALAFAEHNLSEEALEMTAQTEQKKTAATAKRTDKRPRVRV
ncbi:hypothetical protein [Desulfovibrio sp. TomC]|uniref:hypothetical protein n=1 Tax=Desulfovibrio sp. TomC TaxID=1562888 RepID=UPI000574AC61|nr:hypothetical protein [Desulfovibrio sp. TomC]KHK02459.1 hypothetical protein NY78_2217 [Desulfovibrio sp. TomC]